MGGKPCKCAQNEEKEIYSDVHLGTDLDPGTFKEGRRHWELAQNRKAVGYLLKTFTDSDSEYK